MIKKEVLIPRYYTTPEGNTTTIQKLGWRVNVEKGIAHIIHYCEMCQCQRTFTITKEIKKTSQKGIEYVSGYKGYCNFCFDRDNEKLGGKQ